MKSNLPKHLKLILKSLIVITGALMAVLALLLLYQVRDRGKLVSPPATPIFTDRYGVFLAEGTADENAPFGFWDPPPVLPERIVSCLLMIEDKRYYEHFGVDVRSLLRALVNNISGQTTAGRFHDLHAGGAATTPRENEPSGEKRVKWGRRCGSTESSVNENVLRHYLKIVPQGNRIHGVAYAATAVFSEARGGFKLGGSSGVGESPQSAGKNEPVPF